MTAKWNSIESKLAPNCPTLGDLASAQAAVAAHSGIVIALLSGFSTVCPTQLHLKTLAGFGTVPTGTRIETGWTGSAHSRDLLDDCGAGNVCMPLLHPPLPASLANVPVCLEQRLVTDVSGTLDNETGDAAISVSLGAAVATGISQLQPCPTCDGDAVFNDGVRDGTCNGGSRNGLSCDANGTNPTFDSTSFDCRPSIFIGPQLPTRTLNLTTGSATLSDTATTGAAACGSGGALDCHCAVCSGDTTIACNTDAECASRTDVFCDGATRPNGSGFLFCSTNSDCAVLDSECGGGGCGQCTPASQRPCFLPTITAIGLPDRVSPLLVGVNCVAPSGVSLINGIGLPGPQRNRIRFSVTRTP